jgi:hypothetical protein
MTPPRIDTPRGSIVIGANAKAELKWNTDFQQKWLERYSEAQKFVDSEVLRLCEPYTPLRTGMLIKSGTLGTEIGSGTVSWIAPYAKAQYYRPKKPKGVKEPSTETGPLRGPYWFERMKATHVRTILVGARKIIGKGK